MTPSYTLGLLLIVIVAVLWAASSVLVQYLYQDTSHEESSVDALALTFVGVALFALWWPVAVGKPWLRQGTDEPWSWEDQLRHGKIALCIAPVWFLANWAYNSSLYYTSITSSTVLASTGSLWTLIFAVAMKDEVWNWQKLCGVALGLLGSLLTTLQDDDDQDDENNSDGAGRLLWSSLPSISTSSFSSFSLTSKVWGDILGLISAIGYGAYAVQTRVLCPHGGTSSSSSLSTSSPASQPAFSMQLMLGYIGLIAIVTVGPFAVPSLLRARASLGWLALKGILDNVISDYLWLQAVLLTSATVATVGLGLTIPLAIASDLLWHRDTAHVSLASVSGAILVLLGFFVVNRGSQEEDQEHYRTGEHFPLPVSEEDVELDDQIQSTTAPFCDVSTKEEHNVQLQNVV